MPIIIYNQGELINGLIFINNEGVVGDCRTGRFMCYCGKEFVAKLTLVKNGNTTSCGCYHLKVIGDMNRTHGMSESSEYRIWGLMKDRCNNPNGRFYSDYGGRGITVCKRWLESFENFFEDMGIRPSLKHTIDREDNDKGYSKENCRWATKKEQSNNRRNNRLIEYNGETKNLKEWCEKLELNYQNTHKRIYQRGWTIVDAFNPEHFKGSRYYKSRLKIA